MIQTSTFEDLGGGINKGGAAENIAPREWADVSNFYPYETVARRRGGIRRLTTLGSWSDTVLGFRRIKRSNGTQFFIVGGFNGFGKYLDHRIDGIVPVDAVGSTNPNPNQWTILQYKEFGYALRKGGGGLYRVDGYTSARAGIAPPVAAHTLVNTDGSSVGTLAAGSYSAVYTYGNQATGYESNPSPQTTIITLGGTTSLTHSGWVWPSNPFVDMITLYRSLKDQNNGVYYRVATKTPLVNQTFEDFVSISGMGPQVSYNNGVPQTDLILGDIWDERMWATNGRTVRFSQVLNIEGWGDEDEISVNPDDGFDVRGIKAWEDRVIIGKTNAVYYITGTDRRSFDVHTLSEKHGVMAHFTMKIAENTLYFYGSGKTVYRSDGTTVVGISDPKVQPYLDAIADEDEEFLTAAVFPKQNWYVLQLPAEQLEFSATHTYLVYNYASNTWSVFSHNTGGDLVRYLDDAFDEDGNEQMRIGTTGGDIFHFVDNTYDYDDQFVQETYPCPGSVVGVVGDGQGAAIAFGGSFGYALLCNDGSGPDYGPLQADVNGNYTFPSVEAGTYTVTVYDQTDSAYRRTVGAAVVTDGNITNVGTIRPNTLGAHPSC